MSVVYERTRRGTRVRTMTPRRRRHLTYGQWLKHARNAAGLTQAEFGSKIGMDQSYVSKLEREYHSSVPDAEKARMICQALGVTVREMMEAIGYYDEEPEDKDNLMVFASLMSEAEHLDVPDYLKESIKASIRYAKDVALKRGNEGGV